MVRETPSRPGGGPGVTYLADAALPTATWAAWSCEVRVAVSDPHALRPAVAATTALMQRVDAAASRFRPDSDLSWANLNSGRPVAVSPLLVALTRSALDAAALTGGALDPTVGRDLLRLGYDRDILLVADSDHAAEARPRAAAARPTWRDVGLDEVTGLLSVPNGTRLDLVRRPRRRRPTAPPRCSTAGSADPCSSRSAATWPWPASDATGRSRWGSAPVGRVNR